MALVTVEPVARGKPLARFIELPQVLHGHDPRWAPPVMAWERYRLDSDRNPFFERGDGRYWLARVAGRPVGRITAHLAAPGDEGRFGFWDAVDDAAVAEALVDVAAGWLADQGCSSMEGPLSFTAEEEAGVQVAGHDAPGTTGRPWHPFWLAALLEEQGFDPAGERPTWRLATPPDAAEVPPAGEPLPGQAGPYADPRLVLEGIAAVPDVSAELRRAGIRSAWSLARRAKERRWEGATVVRFAGDPAELVPRLLAAAGAAGYQWLVAPWSPDPSAPPEAVHRLYCLTW